MMSPWEFNVRRERFAKQARALLAASAAAIVLLAASLVWFLYPEHGAGMIYFFYVLEVLAFTAFFGVVAFIVNAFKLRKAAHNAGLVCPECQRPIGLMGVSKVAQSGHCSVCKGQVIRETGGRIWNTGGEAPQGR